MGHHPVMMNKPNSKRNIKKRALIANSKLNQARDLGRLVTRVPRNEKLALPIGHNRTSKKRLQHAVKIQRHLDAERAAKAASSKPAVPGGAMVASDAAAEPKSKAQIRREAAMALNEKAAADAAREAAAGGAK